MNFTYRAAFYRNAETVSLQTLRLDHLSPREALLKVDACGICGTDINAILRGADKDTPVGHEVAGRVVDSAGNVTDRRAVLESSSACGQCHACRNGRSWLCTATTSFFARPFLGLAEYMPAPEISVLDYDGMSPEVACLSEPLAVAIDIVDVAGITPESVVLVTGLGPIGLMAVRLAKIAGAARIYASTYSGRTQRNELAMEFGADELLFEDKKPLSDRILTPAPDRILSTVPPSFIGACAAPAAKGAIIAYIGVGHGETDHIHLPANMFHFKKLQLRSSFASPALRTPLALDLLRTGRVNGERLISHRFPLSDAAEAIRVACLDKAGAIKVVVVAD
ncbi:MAG: zinc-binding dehydrogenase [Candidatus Methylacidiphilales bacterium]|nr:alcohol dehydrogenase catalytic domain-containing protein [Candidatus Methylacidiphilales bacterium]